MTQRTDKLFDTSLPFDYGRMTEVIRSLCEQYPFLGFRYLGNSILGREIPLLTLGTGHRKILYTSPKEGSAS